LPERIRNVPRVIHKYPLFGYGRHEVPEGDVLAIGFQADNLFAWIEHNTEWEKYGYKMNLVVFPTGYEFSESMDPSRKHVGSAVSNDCVWHVYKVW
jgi:hypothetical protein